MLDEMAKALSFLWEELEGYQAGSAEAEDSRRAGLKGHVLRSRLGDSRSSEFIKTSFDISEV
jgi:hypothetical protein